MRFCILFLALLSTPVAFASSDSSSRALQLCKRVVSQKELQEMPSRAFWMSHRVATKARALAFHTEKPSKNKKPIRTLRN